MSPSSFPRLPPLGVALPPSPSWIRSSSFLNNTYPDPALLNFQQAPLTLALQRSLRSHHSTTSPVALPGYHPTHVDSLDSADSILGSSFSLAVIFHNLFFPLPHFVSSSLLLVPLFLLLPCPRSWGLLWIKIIAIFLLESINLLKCVCSLLKVICGSEA